MPQATAPGRYEEAIGTNSSRGPKYTKLSAQSAKRCTATNSTVSVLEELVQVEKPRRHTFPADQARRDHQTPHDARRHDGPRDQSGRAGGVPGQLGIDGAGDRDHGPASTI